MVGFCLLEKYVRIRIICVIICVPVGEYKNIKSYVSVYLFKFLYLYVYPYSLT